MLHPVDEECGRRVHSIFVAALHPVRVHQRQVVLVVDAFIHFFLRHARKAALLFQTLLNVFFRQLSVRLTELLDPVHLIREQQINEGKILIPRQTARRGGGHARRAVQRIFAENHADLARIDVVLRQPWHDLALESGAVGTRHRGVFDDGNRRIR